MEVKSFEDLEVWQMGRDLVARVYMMTVSLPRSEDFGLTAQIRRAALSVPANIAEGFGRYHYMDKAKFYLNARGSLSEQRAICSLLRTSGISNGLKMPPVPLA